MENYQGIIYRIKSIITSHQYIGSSINFKHRKQGHLYSLNKNKHHSIKLQKHVNKYGVDDLLFDIVEYVEFKENIFIREQFYIDTLNHEFNMYLKVPGRRVGTKKVVIQKIIKTQEEEEKDIEKCLSKYQWERIVMDDILPFVNYKIKNEIRSIEEDLPWNPKKLM